mmetsp:Transcript_13478/g.40909  ORF Transcript_13478/g.40909 Transcript_13478/m.40909 type:complete len:210 (-) Transcript_13478:167-796(-)
MEGIGQGHGQADCVSDLMPMSLHTRTKRPLWQAPQRQLLHRARMHKCTRNLQSVGVHQGSQTPPVWRWLHRGEALTARPHDSCSTCRDRAKPRQAPSGQLPIPSRKIHPLAVEQPALGVVQRRQDRILRTPYRRLPRGCPLQWCGCSLPEQRLEQDCAAHCTHSQGTRYPPLLSRAAEPTLSRRAARRRGPLPSPSTEPPTRRANESAR